MKALGFLVVLGLAWPLSAAALDLYGALRRPRGRYGAIVVAGCRVMPDGAPSKALRRRAELAARLHREGWADRVVLTGGIGVDAPRSEARVAAEVCLASGVPEGALILEEASTTTEENARFAAALVGRQRVLVATDSYHAFRCARTFRRHFGEADAVGALPEPHHRVRMALREVGAVLTYGVRGRL